MALVTQQFIDTWRAGKYTGQHKPVSIVEIGRHKYQRDWAPGPRLNAYIPGESGDAPWWPYTFEQLEPWRAVPNVKSVEAQKANDQNGMQVATIVFDNVGYIEVEGALGDLYRQIERGYYAPYRGFTPPTRAAAGVPAANDWADTITEMATLRIWQGFGEPERELDGSIALDGGANGAWVFFGTVDDVDLDSDPATVTLTARMGAPLTDQRIFGWNKSRQLRDPVTFRDRLEAHKTFIEGTNARASTAADGFPAAAVLDSDEDAATVWRSDADISDIEWVQIKVPQGRYRELKIDAPADAELYIGVYPYTLTEGEVEPPTADDIAIPEREWHNRGLGTVSGPNGGWEYASYVESWAGGEHTLVLDSEYELGSKSVIRVGVKGPAAYSEVRRLEAIRRRLPREIKSLQHIIIDDVSDMVKVALRWAGYDEWEVEDTGIRVPGRLVFSRSDFLISIIDKAKELTGFTFFLADPTNGDSFGVPTFRRQSALVRGGGESAELRDTELLTGSKVKLSQEPRGYIIRVRGKEATERHGGRTLGGDKVRRIMYVYRPPWSQDRSMAGIVKHVTYQNPGLRTIAECKMGAYLIAIEEALKAVSILNEGPANANVELDDQVGTFEMATGVNMRMLVTSRTITHEMGERPRFDMTLEGVLLDSPDLVALLEEIEADDWDDEQIPLQLAILREVSRAGRIRP